MSNNVHLRFLGVFQPGPQVRQDFPSLRRGARFPGLHSFAQAHDHLSNGLQFLHDGVALDFKRAAFFICSDQNHANLCLLC